MQNRKYYKTMGGNIMNISDKVRQRLRTFSNSLLQTQYPLLNVYKRHQDIRQGYIGVVYMLHRICNKDNSKLPPNEDLKISPQHLQHIIDRYKKAGFDFLSVSDVSHHIKQQNTFPKPFVCFTIDDGYMDNYVNAYPIFKRNHIPFCIYIATDFIDKKAILWWFDVENLILSNESLTYKGKLIECKSRQQKWDTFRIMREDILQLNQNNLFKELPILFNGYNIDWLSSVTKYAMNWEQIEELSRDPLCTIGGHTKSHLSLQGMNAYDTLSQITEGNQLITQHTGQDITHFSLPYGRTPDINIDKELSLLGMQSISYANGGPINMNQDYINNSIVYLPRQILI
jgi:peptidoglycan/xylan/chitin deacetylase (PgdA/CDA1 family)